MATSRGRTGQWSAEVCGPGAAPAPLHYRALERMPRPPGHDMVTKAVGGLCKLRVCRTGYTTEARLKYSCPSIAPHWDAISRPFSCSEVGAIFKVRYQNPFGPLPRSAAPRVGRAVTEPRRACTLCWPSTFTVCIMSLHFEALTKQRTILLSPCQRWGNWARVRSYHWDIKLVCARARIISFASKVGSLSNTQKCLRKHTGETAVKNVAMEMPVSSHYGLKMYNL